ncbi:hypothetical protein [Burkholderia gladioli]|uniref:hypothetical protein n=1 Tax=Burkholderia gladioli TaxID=28095 RepID=UPI000A5B18D9|nr:hypothetical protein [Burkholderia gladioli]
MKLRFGGARYSAMTAVGHELDGIGELIDVDLPRLSVETDQAYRERLIVKLDWLCGYSKTIEFDIADLGKYRLWLEQSTLLEIDGLRYLVQSVIYENGRAGAWLMPAVPLQLIEPTIGIYIDKRLTPASPEPTPQPNHVRDAVNANR